MAVTPQPLTGERSDEVAMAFDARVVTKLDPEVLRASIPA